MKLVCHLAVLLSCLSCSAFAVPIKALIVDGRHNHEWEKTTPIMKRHLESTGLFSVDVATSPPEGESIAGFNPPFANYGLVVLNYNGELWSAETREAFVDYVAGGGGLVVVHAANNAFGEWKEYNEIIGLGGWGGRSKASGPYVYMKNWKLVHDYESDGPAGAHEGNDKIVLDTRLPDHPIMQGMPARWYQYDELYNFMRGPGQNMTVLATAYSGKPADQGGSGRDEPLLFTLTYGNGRVFHTMLGHDLRSMRGEGFALTFVRGAEWAATGNVTIPVTKEIPRPLEPYEAVGQLDAAASYHPVQEVLAELAAASGDPEQLAKIEAALVGYVADPNTPFDGLQAAANALGILGSKAAVPALAGLLHKDEPHASVARLALERIAGPEAAHVLLEELKAGCEFNRDGIINTLGVRRETAAIPLLKSFAASGNATAIAALGKMGTAESLAVLQELPPSSTVTSAMLLCADRLMAAGETSAARPVFDALLKQEGLPKQHVTAALRGLLALDPEAGMATVWTMLADDSQSQVALNVLGGVPGSAMLANDILRHFDGLPLATQTTLVAVLGSMAQPEALPKILDLAQSAQDASIKEAAMVALGQIPGDVASVAFLCAAANDYQNPFRKVARLSLASTPGSEAERLIVEGIFAGDASAREEYINAAKNRALDAARPALLQAAEDTEPGVRREALEALRKIGAPEDYPLLLALVPTTPEDTRDVAVRAVEFTGRKIDEPAQRLAPLLAVMEQGGATSAVALMPVLADISSEAALAAVIACAQGDPGEVRDAAFAALGEWKNPAAIDAVLRLASDTGDPAVRSTLMKTFGNLLARAGDVPADLKLEQCRQALALGLDTPGKEALLKAVSEIVDGRALRLIEEVGTDPELREAALRASATIKQALLGDPLLSASENERELKNALDGDPTTRWSTNGSMKPGMWFGIDLRMDSTIYAITLDATASPNDYPRGYEVYIGDEAIDTASATPAANGVGTEKVTRIEFSPPVKGRYIKIVQTGEDGLFWSIHELTVSHDPGFASVTAPEIAVSKLLDGDGLISDWNVAGPFTDTGKQGAALFHAGFGPEFDPSMAAWQPLDPAVVENGAVNLDKLFGGDDRVAYLLTNLVANEPMQLTLSMGSDDGIKAWLGGALVHEHMAIRPMVADNDQVPITLVPGTNTLLVKVVDVGGSWGAIARLTRSKSSSQ